MTEQYKNSHPVNIDANEILIKFSYGYDKF